MQGFPGPTRTYIPIDCVRNFVADLFTRKCENSQNIPNLGLVRAMYFPEEQNPGASELSRKGCACSERSESDSTVLRVKNTRNFVRNRSSGRISRPQNRCRRADVWESRNVGGGGRRRRQHGSHVATPQRSLLVRGS